MNKGAVGADDESRWQVLCHREQSAAQDFIYGVRTTGIYCRPGCSSRLPRSENVVFFDSWQDAEQAGYRPCKRCRADAVPPAERLQASMVQACRRIEQAETNPSLATLAAEAALSPWHFQRLFKKIIGVTPKQYAAAQQKRRLRAGLTGQRSVTEALYHAGFGSSSRGYEHAREHLAMPPSLYRKGGAGLVIRYGITACLLGHVLVATTPRGICAIEIGDDSQDVVARMRNDFPHACLEEAGPDFQALLLHVVACVTAQADGAGLPLDIRGTAFQHRVWYELRKIPAGTTVSYAKLAERIDRPQAARAVGRACAANRLAVAIPCHRVVRGDGQLGGYRWGLERKQALLQLEKIRVGDPPATAAALIDDK